MRTHNIPSCYRKIKEILIMPLDLAVSSTLIGSNYPCLKLIFIVQEVFEPFKFDCTTRLMCLLSKHLCFLSPFPLASLGQVVFGDCGFSWTPKIIF